MQHQVVSRDEWIAARKAHLAKEKALTKARDQLSAERRALPWVKVEKNYVFETPSGKKTLGDLFGGRSQLIVYHFMLGPDWGEGCPSGWLKDRFGLSWQVVPVVLLEMMMDPDARKSARVMKAFMQMKKFDIATLKRAYDDEAA